MRALPGENPAGGDGCDTNDGWITGNIVFDRDVYDAGDHGDFGVSLKAGRVAFGAGVGSSGNTVCGVTDVADGAWHHVAVTRRASDGLLRVYVDGVLDAEGPGSPGNASYRDGRTTAYPGSDPFLVIGAEKHDAGSAYPSYSGWIDEVRLSTVLRYTGSGFTRPSGPFAPDASTAALYHLDEGAGDLVGDASGGNSHGTRMYGGSPAGPEWSSEAAPLDSARRAALEEVISGAGRAVAIANAGDRLFVVDANGRILAYQVTPDGDVNPLSGVYLDIQDRVLAGGERGLLGLAFHPNHASNGYFFVYYTAKANGSLGLKDGDIVIARYRASPADSNSVVSNTERILLTIEHWKYANHNGGGMAFGPDGHLYAAVGDGGGGGDPLQSGQNRGTLLGKVLRLAVDVSEGPAPYYSVPSDNPFVDTDGAAAGDLGLGPPKPLAHLVRPPHGRPLHRRRRPGKPRGGEPPAHRQRRRRELRLAAHGREGLLQPGLGVPDGKPRPPHPRLRPQRGLLGHWWVSLPRLARALPPRRVRVRRLLQQEDLDRHPGAWRDLEQAGAPRHGPEHHHVRRGRGRGDLRRPHRRDRPSDRPGAAAAHRHAVGRGRRNSEWPRRPQLRDGLQRPVRARQDRHPHGRASPRPPGSPGGAAPAGAPAIASSR